MFVHPASRHFLHQGMQCPREAQGNTLPGVPEWLVMSTVHVATRRAWNKAPLGFPLSPRIEWLINGVLETETD